MVMIKHFFFLILTFAIMLVSCSDESQDEVIPRSAMSDQILENTNTVVTDKGEVIVLEDSTVIRLHSQMTTSILILMTMIGDLFRPVPQMIHIQRE